jgi:hypothetical protein
MQQLAVDEAIERAPPFIRATLGQNSMNDKPHHRDRLLPAGNPQQIDVLIDGKNYTLGWHKRSGKYRFRIQRDHRQLTAWFGPNPAQAKADASQDIPRILKGEPASPALVPETRVRKRCERPTTIAVKAFNREYVLRLDQKKQYRCKVQGDYITATGDPDRAPDVFKQKLLAKLFPEQAPVAEVTLESAIGEWMGIQTVSVGEKRLSSARRPAGWRRSPLEIGTSPIGVNCVTS